MRLHYSIILLSTLLIATWPVQVQSSAVIDAVAEYMAFTEYGSGALIQKLDNSIAQ